MKKAVLKRLQTIADQLPQVAELKQVGWITGKEFKKQFPDVTRDKKRKPIKDDEVYKNPGLKEEGMVNHIERLKKAYAQKGDVGVSEYVRWAHRRHMEQQRDKEQREKEKRTIKVI